MRQLIEIAGGGIAGLSLGVALRERGVPVRLFEAGRYPRHRLCGEFLNGVSEETLRSLGVVDLFADACRHREMTWWRGGDFLTRGRLSKAALGLSRWALDQRLAERFVDLGGELCEGQRVKDFRGEGRVDARGRVYQKTSRLLGLKAHFEGVSCEGGLEMHLGDEGYVGVTPVEGGRVNVCGLFVQNGETSGRGSARLLSYLRASGLLQLAERLGSGDAVEKSVCGVSGVAFGVVERSGGVALGDAERMIPPFTGNGMSMAFEAAECVVEVLAGYSRGDFDWLVTERQAGENLEKRFARRLKVAEPLHRMLVHPVGQHWISSVAKPGLVPFNLLNRILT